MNTLVWEPGHFEGERIKSSLSLFEKRKSIFFSLPCGCRRRWQMKQSLFLLMRLEVKWCPHLPARSRVTRGALCALPLHSPHSRLPSCFSSFSWVLSVF